MSEASEKYFADRPYLSQWMNSIVVLGSEQQEGVEAINAAGAVSYLKENIFNGVGFEGTELIKYLVEIIPESYRDTTSKLDQLDLRPFIDMAVDAKVVDAGDAGKTSFFANSLRAGENDLRQLIDRQYRAQFEEFVKIRDANNPPSPEKLKREVDKLMLGTRGYSPMAISGALANQTRLPTSTKTSQEDAVVEQGAEQAQTAGTENESFDPSSMEGGFNFGVDYQTQLRLNPDLDITDLVSGGSVFEGDSSEVFNASALVQQITGMIASQDNKMWDLNEAVTFIYSYQDDPTKVKRLQKLLTDSGYFQTLNALPESGQIDDATRQAWNLFLTDALRSGRTPLDQAKFAREAFQTKLAGDTGYMAIDPATISSTARQLGEAIIGRPLSAKETYDLVNKAKDWQREAFVRGQTNPEQMQTDVQAQIEQHLRQTYNDDIVLDSVRSSRDTLASLFGGAS